MGEEMVHILANAEDTGQAYPPSNQSHRHAVVFAISWLVWLETPRAQMPHRSIRSGVDSAM